MASDRKRVYGNSNGCILSIDPSDGSFVVLGEGPSGIRACGMAVVPLRGDLNGDGVADLDDHSVMSMCIGGPLHAQSIGIDCAAADLDVDGDVDLFDFRFFQWAFGGDG